MFHLQILMFRKLDLSAQFLDAWGWFLSTSDPCLFDFLLRWVPHSTASRTGTYLPLLCGSSSGVWILWPCRRRMGIWIRCKREKLGLLSLITAYNTNSFASNIFYPLLPKTICSWVGLILSYFSVASGWHFIITCLKKKTSFFCIDSKVSALIVTVPQTQQCLVSDSL